MQNSNIIQCQKLVAANLPFERQGDALNFELLKGETVSIIGPNNAEKSQWLRTITGLERQSSGTLHIHGINTLHLSSAQWSMTRMKIAYVHADTALLSAANGLLNTLIPALYHRLDKKLKNELLADKALNLLEEIDPQLNLNDLPAYISREQQFKIAVARALLLAPDVLALDSPFTHFENDTKISFQNFLSKQVAAGLSLLIITSDIPYALENSDKIIFLEKEKIHQFNSRQEILNCEIPAVKEYITVNA